MRKSNFVYLVLLVFCSCSQDPSGPTPPTLQFPTNNEACLVLDGFHASIGARRVSVGAFQKKDDVEVHAVWVSKVAKHYVILVGVFSKE